MRRSDPTTPSRKSAQTPAPAEPKDALAAFRARLESGRFNAVLGRALRRTIRDAAADPGLDAEVGALRLALARLLTEERDPTRLATGVSRLTAVAVQAARLRQPADSEADQIQTTLARVLAEIDAELAATQNASPLAIPTGDWCEPAASILDAESPDAESPSPISMGEGLG